MCFQKFNWSLDTISLKLRNQMYRIQLQNSLWSLRVLGDTFWVDKCTNYIHGSYEQGVSPLSQPIRNHIHRWYFGILKECKRTCFSPSVCFVNFERLSILCQVFEVRVLLDEVVSLRHVTRNGIFVNPKKVETIINWERPKNVAKIRSFLG